MSSPMRYTAGRLRPRLIAVGETMAMITPAHAEPLATASELRLHVGGAESNVAMHAAALGIPSAWVSAVGDDALGERIRREVAARGVDVGWVVVDPHAPTGVYFKDPGNGVLYYRRGSAASCMTAGSIAEIPLEQAEVVHVSGITPALSADCAALMDALVERVSGSEGVLSFDVNHRAPLWETGAAAPLLLGLARRTDLVFVGLDEANALWGCETAAEVRTLLPEPERLVVKDGDVGATEFERRDDRDVETFVPAIPTVVVEPVGAGDAFAAGYLAAFLNNAGSEDRLRAGHERAHLVLQSTSDFVPEQPASEPARTDAPR
ncbi:sugar kinase [Humibacter ginsengiterrae]